MKLFAIVICYKADSGVRVLKGAYDLTSFGFFQRNAAHEFMIFTSKIVVERTPTSSRASIKEKDDKMCHCYVRSDNLAGVVISDHEYVQRVAQTLVTKVLEDFAKVVPPSEWTTVDDSSCKFTALPQTLAKYQNPREADAMTRIQADLDDTKIIMHNNIEAVLDRGEKLDDLVEKSESLGAQSKLFYKTAKKTNSCCQYT